MAKRNNRLKVLRAERDLTQAALAAVMKMPRDRYLRIEHETTLPTPDERLRFVLVLNAIARRLKKTLVEAPLVTEASTGLATDPRGATRGPRPRRARRSSRVPKEGDRPSEASGLTL